MEHSDNSTTPQDLSLQTENAVSETDKGNGDAYLYILIVMSFYGIFLFGIMLVYFRSKRREKRRTNVFTRLVHEEEQREWGALPRKRSITLTAFSGLRAVQVSLPFPTGNYGVHEGRVRSPLACALCMEQSSISSLCSADVHFAIEEESDCGPAECSGEAPKVSQNSNDSASTRREEL